MAAVAEFAAGHGSPSFQQAQDLRLVRAGRRLMSRCGGTSAADVTVTDCRPAEAEKVCDAVLIEHAPVSISACASAARAAASACLPAAAIASAATTMLPAARSVPAGQRLA